MKLHKNLSFEGQCAFVCSNDDKQCSLCANNNKGTLAIHYKGEICTFAYKMIPVIHMTIKLCPSTVLTLGTVGVCKLSAREFEALEKTFN